MAIHERSEPGGDTEPFPKRLKRLRQRNRLSLKEMAEQLGVPVTTYREWEYGRTIRGQPYVRMSEVLRVSLRDSDRDLDENPYLVEPKGDEVAEALDRNANKGRLVCVSGIVGAHGDPDLIIATGVRQQ